MPDDGSKLGSAEARGSQPVADMHKGRLPLREGGYKAVVPGSHEGACRQADA